MKRSLFGDPVSQGAITWHSEVSIFLVKLLQLSIASHPHVVESPLAASLRTGSIGPGSKFFRGDAVFFQDGSMANGSEFFRGDVVFSKTAAWPMAPNSSAVMSCFSKTAM